MQGQDEGEAGQASSNNGNVDSCVRHGGCQGADTEIKVFAKADPGMCFFLIPRTSDDEATRGFVSA